MEPTTIQTTITPVIYWWFRKRVLAILVDTWFGIFIIPTLVSIYYYFAEGQTLGYKVVWLKIFRSNEQSKPWFKRLLARWIVQGGWSFTFIYYWLFWSLIGYTLWMLSRMGDSQTEILVSTMKTPINQFLGLLSVLSLVFGMLIMPLSILLNSKKRWRHDKIVDTTVVQVSEVKTLWSVVWVVLFAFFMLQIIK